MCQHITVMRKITNRNERQTTAMTSFSSTLPLLFFKLYHLQKWVGLGFFLANSTPLCWNDVFFLPCYSFKQQVTPRCSPTHVLKKTPFFFYCILSPMALSIKVSLREFSTLVHTGCTWGEAVSSGSHGRRMIPWDFWTATHWGKSVAQKIQFNIEITQKICITVSS